MGMSSPLVRALEAAVSKVDNSYRICRLLASGSRGEPNAALISYHFDSVEGLLVATAQVEGSARATSTVSTLTSRLLTPPDLTYG
jgi:hypothetical protein